MTRWVGWSGPSRSTPRSIAPTSTRLVPSKRGPAFGKALYRDRNVVGRCFARLKQFRAIATRFDKLADRYRAGLVLASLVVWLREPTG